MRVYVFQSPEKIIYGPGALDQVGTETAALGQRALIVTGKNSARKSGILDKLLSSIKSSGVQAAVFDEVSQDPDIETVERGVEAARRAKSQVIVALGGGSALDAAKGIGMMLTNPGTITDYERKAPLLAGIPVIGVPTTAGTGSEVSRYTVITDRG